jgi:hypothetical protein
MEGATEVICIEASDDDALAHIGQAYDEVNHGFAEELRFINADHFCTHVELGLDLHGVADGLGVNTAVVVGDNLVTGIALVNNGLENLHALARDLSASQTADQLFTLAAEHWPTDYFNPAQISPHWIH